MNSEQQRQIKIDADIDEVIKTIQGLGLKLDEKTTATDSCSEISSRGRIRWIRWAVVKIPVFAIGAFAGFVGGYTLHAPNSASDIRIHRWLEIRRAIPVEVRRAIPVHPEIRKARAGADWAQLCNTIRAREIAIPENSRFVALIWSDDANTAGTRQMPEL